MKYATAFFVSLLLLGCNEETADRIEFSNCLNGVTSPKYAEVAKACAEAAIAKRAARPLQGENQ